MAAAGETILRRCAGLVRELSDRAYAMESKAIRGGTIGKHVRHSADHFAAVMAAAEGGGVIDYDQRTREVPMETDRGLAAAALADLAERVGGLGADVMDRAVRVRVMVSGDGVEAELWSSLGRELAFATHHAVHHHAMIGAIALEAGFEAGADFGKAPSTVSYERSAGRRAPGQGG